MKLSDYIKNVLDATDDRVTDVEFEANVDIDFNGNLHVYNDKSYNKVRFTVTRK